jgi:RNA polymerase sigma-70 factor (ECF subfamily)
VTPLLAERPDHPPDRDAALAAAAVAVRRYLRFLGCDWALADDLAQEALLAGIGSFAAGAPPLPWLFTAARNGYRMHLRKVGRRREVGGLEALHADWIEVAGDDAGEARRRALHHCLDELPPRSRRALELRYGEDSKRSAIARELGLGDEGIKSLLVRLRTALAACVQRRLTDG